MAEFDFAPLEPLSGAAPMDMRSVLDAARAEADAIRATARAEGYAAGQMEAVAAAGPAVTALEHAAAATREHAATVAVRLEGDAVDLAFAVAEKILAASVAADPQVVLEAVRGALRGIVERERVTLLVNPEDLEIVRASRDGIMASLGGMEHCEVQAERRVGRGGAVVRYADGLVDARVETKLERAREVVAAALGDAGAR